MFPVIHLVRTDSTTIFGSGNNNSVGTVQESSSYWINIEVPVQNGKPALSIQRNDRGKISIVYDKSLEQTIKSECVSIQMLPGNYTIDITE